MDALQRLCECVWECMSSPCLGEVRLREYFYPAAVSVCHRGDVWDGRTAVWPLKRPATQ